MNQPSRLRIRRPPIVEEPYDDEVAERAPQIIGTLALELPGLDRPPRVPLHLVPPAEATDPAGPPPPLGPTATRLAQAIAEVLAGGRSASQLAGHASLDVLRQLERSTGRLSGPLRRAAVGPPPQPRVTSVHVSEPSPRVAEICVVIDTGVRRRALALRLEAPASRWRLTAMQLA